MIAGRENLSGPLILKFAGILELNKEEEEYFINLVRYNQSQTIDERNRYYERLMAVTRVEVKVIFKVDILIRGNLIRGNGIHADLSANNKGRIAIKSNRITGGTSAYDTHDFGISLNSDYSATSTGSLFLVRNNVPAGFQDGIEPNGPVHGRFPITTSSDARMPWPTKG